jgi:hypothetical protein
MINCNFAALTDLIFRKDYTYLSDQNAFYKVHQQKMVFSDAVTTCSAEGGQLFVPYSKNELEAISNLVIDPTSVGFWLGITDLFSEGYFVNLNGTIQ